MTTAFVWILRRGHARREYLLIDRFVFVLSHGPDRESAVDPHQYGGPSQARRSAIFAVQRDEKDGYVLTDDVILAYEVALGYSELVRLQQGGDVREVRRIVTEIIGNGKMLR